MRNIPVLLAVFLTALLLGLSGCGGGGSGSSSETSGVMLSATSGVVADGYLRGAKVCSDQNSNKRCDPDEPTTITGPGGAYTLEGADLDQYSIIVEVTGTVIDEDTDAVVPRGYLLSTPPGRPEFISPLTTMVQRQLEQNPALSIDDAEEVVRTQIGGGDEIDLFEDFVDQQESESPTAESYERLHFVAQVVASTLGQMQEEIEVVASRGNFDDDDLDELAEIVANRVLERLADIAGGVDEQVAADDFDPDEFNPVQVASGVVTSSMEEAPVTPETLAEEVEEAAVEVEVGSVQELLEGDGWHWVDFEEYGNGEFEVQRGVITSPTAGSFHENEFVFNSDDEEWQPVSDDENFEYYLTADGWVNASEVPDQVTYNEDGSATLHNSISGEHISVSLSESDFTPSHISSLKAKMAPLLNDVDLENPPDGAKVYNLVWRWLVDLYNYDADDDYVTYWNGPVETKVYSYNELLATFAKGSGNSLFIDRDFSLQFGDDNTVDIFEGQGDAVASGTYEIRSVYGLELLVLDLPSDVLIEADFEGQPIFVELDDGIKVGHFYPANYLWPTEMQDYIFNSLAMDYILDSFNDSLSEIPFAYVQWRTQEDSVNDRARGWISLPIFTSYEDVVDIKLKNTAGDVVASVSGGDFHPDDLGASYQFLDYSTASPFSFTSPEVGYWAVLSSDLPDGNYVYELEMTNGETLQKTVHYESHRHMPVISSDTIEPVWNDNGSLTITWENPDSDSDWNLVDKLRINIGSSISPVYKRIVINLLPGVGESFTVSSANLNNFFTPEELEHLFIHILTRAYDSVYDTNYARGKSDSVTLGDLSISFAYIQWRTYEDSSQNKVRTWMTLPTELTYADVADVRIETPTGGVVASLANGELRSSDVSTFRYLDCFSGICSGNTSPDAGYYATLSEIPTGEYTYILETTDGDTLEKEVYYQQGKSLPVIDSDTVESVWDADGSLTVSWENPSADAAWSAVEKLRLNLRSFKAMYSKQFIVNLSPDTTSFTIPVQELAGYFTDRELDQLKIEMQTREYEDTYNTNYARGVSDEVNFGDFPIFAYVQWRSYEDSSQDKVRGWITLPSDLSYGDISAVKLENSSGQVVASLATGEYQADNGYATDRIINCLSGTCTSYTDVSGGYSATLSDALPTGVYTYVLETTQGDTREKEVYYESHKSLPVIPAGSIVATWNDGSTAVPAGTLTIDFDRPTTDPNWSDVDQIRINVNLGRNERIVVKIPRDFQGPFTLGASEFNGLSETGKAAVTVDMQTRSYDDQYDTNYARGWTGQPTFYKYDGLSEHYDFTGDASNGEIVGSEIDIVSANVAVTNSEIQVDVNMLSDIDNISFNDPQESYGWRVFFDVDGDGDSHSDTDDLDISIFQSDGGTNCVFWREGADINLSGSCSFDFVGNTVSITLDKAAFNSAHSSEFDINSVTQNTPVRVNTYHHADQNSAYITDVMPNGW